MELGSTLKKLRLEKDLRQLDIAMAIGVTESAYSNYEKELRAPSHETLGKLADFYNVTIDYLLGRTTNRHVQHVPVFENIPAGIPMDMIEDFTEYEDVLVENTDKKYFAIRIKGNSMSDIYHDGDVVIMEKVEDCPNNSDCVVAIGSEVTFKRIKKTFNGIMLIPLNSDYQVQEYTNTEIVNLPIRLLGVAKELRRIL